ncbi:GTP-binding protein Rhes [Gouania willdenowi]|uniref:Dexamethasone-induced Ras-related protein 1-like n=1 Tax=Gouania willdenowi TaxID=441366 RepID=A0A8C5E8D6_GOUWI|nr:dexamethasone-induced Ras-related protein 1-like [Gouania willdenowi]
MYAEMNATESLNLPVDAIVEMFHFLSELHQTRITHAPLQSAGELQQKVSIIPKAGMGIITKVKGCWKKQDKKVVADSNNLKESSDRLSLRSVDLLGLGLTKPRNCHRLVLLGAPRVGKTNILQRFLGKEFKEQYEPTSEDFHRKLFYIGGEAYQVDLLDAASERHFPAKRRLTLLTGDIFLLVFSLQDRESLNEVCKLMNEIKAAKAKTQTVKNSKRLPVVICGNKSDVDAQRVVRRSEVSRLLGEDALFFETSAKSGAGLDALFKALATLGGLPTETSPSQHQIVPILTYQSVCVGLRGRIGRRTAPCAALDSQARRPSFTSDLRLVLGSSTKHNKPEKCQIQ